jgi:flagellar secretion chaperone FliS
MDANLTYRTCSSRASSGVGIVILLYEQLVQDLRRAIAGIETNDIEVRTFELTHAVEVVGQLQGRLDMQNGGDVAQNLDRFYSVLQAGILDAQVKVSKPLLEQLIDNVLSIREAWLDVERSTESGQGAAESSAIPKVESPELLGQGTSRKWRV